MTYDQLKEAVLSYFGNYPDPDPRFAALLPTIIEMAESRVYSNLRHPQMVRTKYIVELSDSGVRPFLVPSDMLEPHSVVDSVHWEYLSVPNFYKMVTDNCANQQLWTIHGTELVVWPEPTTTAIFSYYAKPVPLSSDDSTAVFSLYPHLFLAASLAEAARHLREPDTVKATLQQEFLQHLNEVRKEAWSATLPHKGVLRVKMR